MDNKTEPLVTIMIPAYNGSRYVADTIQSVIHQTHSNIELLITDDASSDNTSEIINSIKDHGINSFITALKTVHGLALYHTDVYFDKTEKNALYNLKVLWEGLQRMEGN